MDEQQREGRVVGRIPADTFGHRLMLARADGGNLTIREAADKCGLNYGSWSNWERGSLPRDKVEVVEAIAEGLGVDRDWLLHGGPLTRPERQRRIRVTKRHPRLAPPNRRVRRPRRIDRLGAVA